MVAPYEYGGYDLSRMYPANHTTGTTLYSKLIATVSGLGMGVYPHHPLQCHILASQELDDDGLRCKHAAVDILEEKLQAAITYSIAELLLEIARETL